VSKTAHESRAAAGVGKEENYCEARSHQVGLLDNV
jgi:hypothetical protein